MLKTKREKGRWLRKIVVEHGPALVSRPGMSDAERDRQNADFGEWAKRDRERWEEAFDVRRIIKNLKPALLAYLRREGFRQLPGRIDFLGNVEGRRIFASEAWDAHPVVYAAWESIQLIGSIESALARGDIAHACGFAFNLGKMIKEAEALSAWPRFGANNRTGKMSALHDIVRDAERRLADRGWTKRTTPARTWLRTIMGEMRADKKRVRLVVATGKLEILDRGTWAPLPRRFAATVSGWEKKPGWLLTVRG